MVGVADVIVGVVVDMDVSVTKVVEAVNKVV